ncbi:hypothetical protein [Leptolyngbya sp. 7M]|uniref:hypothetical protein n=1 Tax=Leptolyngbya sp. 7M TaxID=2812896 RepID=UPI001B8CD86A|nr:hypothetical protein [Leptolyngbya sp. 7M]QYO66907.1 hypothetical protein JVX88_08920 [Leptolyngbya sp. 7M]
MRLQNGTMFLASLMVLMAVVLGCGGANCRSELIVDGQVYTGLDPKEDQAVTNSCTKYCIDGDPDFDLEHKKWLETPEAQKVSERDNKWAA